MDREHMLLEICNAVEKFMKMDKAVDLGCNITSVTDITGLSKEQKERFKPPLPDSGLLFFFKEMGYVILSVDRCWEGKKNGETA